MAKKDLRTKSIKERHSKVSTANLGSIPDLPTTVTAFIDKLPDVLAATDLKALYRDILEARNKGLGVVFGMGGHVIKTGVSPYLIELMKQGFIKAIAMNGAAMIHDFEMAYYGETSEDVEQEIVRGDFGLAEETGFQLNSLIRQGYDRKEGLGETMTRAFQDSSFRNKKISILSEAGRLGIPATIHVAVGTDIIHMHPDSDGAAIGQGSLLDFQRFCEFIAALDQGGGYLNLGSAVILPEVFLKAISLARNKNAAYGHFFTANFDFIRHYRPTQSVIYRPTLLGARSYSLIGHHEIMIPLLAVMLLEAI
ncbi:hypothetical protein ACFL27_23195 [candidate division CSSED10-310 bacterium]|uniref:Deoxyhypusine synthase n=1 Tax=candidate division CSSED10-310 bacterium TaxID=2855610 RepID=A0ABV6Z3U3_UNCC1